VLYGKSDASNSEVLEAANIANAMDFIDKNDLFSFDESAQSLIAEMKKHKDDII